MVAEFEKAFAAKVGASWAVAFSSGTAALHAAYFAAGVCKDTEVITSPLTFAATANSALYLQARPVFADIEIRTGNIDPISVADRLSEFTKAIVGVDFGGLPCDVSELRSLAEQSGCTLIIDAAHSLGADIAGTPVGCQADLTTFSFHPVKTITTGEGGMVVGHQSNYERTLRNFRTHGIERNSEHFISESHGPWYHEMQELGNNYRLTDFQSALGLSQLGRLDEMVRRRREIAQLYRELLQGQKIFVPQAEVKGCLSAYHLFPVRVQLEQSSFSKRWIVEALHAENIGVQVHYIPVYRHPFYQNLGYLSNCPNADLFYEQVFSLPIFPSMTDDDVNEVVDVLQRIGAVIQIV